MSENMCAPAKSGAWDSEGLTEAEETSLRLSWPHATDGSLACMCGDCLVPMMRAVARIVADRERSAATRTLEEAATEFATGGWADAFLAGAVEDDESAVRATEAWLRARAARLREQGGE